MNWIRNQRLELLMLVLAGFLAPIIGGQVPIDAQPLQSDFFTALMGGSELPLTARCLVAVLTLVGIGAILLRRRVLPLPSMNQCIRLTLLIGMLCASILNSEYRFISWESWLTWLTYGAALCLAVGASGKGIGVRVGLWSLCAGTTIVGLKGVAEYVAFMQREPTHRIFADWNNPNAVAGMLLIGIAIGLGLAVAGDRKSRIVAAAFVVPMVTALAMTQSKGAYLAFGLLVLAFSVLVVAHGAGKRFAWIAVPLLLGGCLAFGIPKLASKSEQGVAFQRIAASSSTGDQSVGFRKILWKSAVDLIKQNPMGYGVGTYRFQSAKTGATPMTHYAHQTFLQVGVEGGVIALVALILWGSGWLWDMFRGAKKMPRETNLLRAACIAGVLATVAHGCVESNLYYFGIGFSFFMLCGLGLQLSGDGATLELVPAQVRRLGALLLCAIPCLGMIYFATVEIRKSLALSTLTGGDPEAVSNQLAGLRASAVGDGEVWYLSAKYGSAGPEDRLKFIANAVELQPTPQYLRVYARALEESEKLSSAKMALSRALKYDPSNLLALKMQMDMQEKAGEVDQARLTAERIVEVGNSSYVQVRAIPENVPTEPADAQLFLAHHSKDPKEQMRRLEDAVATYKRYLEMTVPKVKQFSSGGQGMAFAGESLQSAAAKMETARAAAKELAALYRVAGESQRASETESDASGFRVD